jgi:chromosome segregation ATPase
MGFLDAAATQQATQGATESSQQVTPQDEISQLKEQLRKKEEALTSKFHGLTSRERMLMQKEQEIKDKLGQVGSVDELRQLADKEPLKLLERFGLNYDKLTDIYAGMTPEDETKKTVSTLKQEIESLKSKLQEDQAQGQMKEIMRVKDAKLDALKSLASREGSGYDLVSTFGNYDDVLAYMSEHYNATGEILSDEEALEHIESRLAESFKTISANPRVKKLLGLGEPEPQRTEPARPFGLNDSKFRTETPRAEHTGNLSDAQLFELALSKMPSMK